MSGRSESSTTTPPSADDDLPDYSSLIPDSRYISTPPLAAAELAPASSARTGEVHRVLEELDRLSDDLRRRAGTGASVDVPTPEEWDEGLVDPVGFSPYLEERLSLASASVAALSQELRDMGSRWQTLEETAAQLEQEIGNAAREMGFLRSSEQAAPEERPLAAEPPAALATRSGAPRPAVRSRAPRPPPYGNFTIAKYNSTIGNLKARRRRLAWWTVGLAAAISAVLVYLTFIAHEPMPAVWLAVLPVVWMIPVPFFILSFFATQRVLRRNHLDLAGDP